MDDLQALEDWVGPILQRIAPAERARLARSIAQQLRRSQQHRIKAQRNPDGTPFAPRKAAKLRNRAGQIKRLKTMFSKLRTARHLKTRSDRATAMVGFTGRVAKIARVHQDGLNERTAPRGPVVHYDQRRILGLSDANHDHIREAVLKFLLNLSA